MALFTAQELKDRAFLELSKSEDLGQFSSMLRSRKIEAKLVTLLYEQKNHSPYKVYDIFLSHSSKDAELVEGLKLKLEDLGLSVYVDWIEDPQLDREKVTLETAVTLQKRMRQSKSLIYAYSENGAQSRWMPWELGFFDGLKGLVSILPIVSQSTSDRYVGAEFLGLYNYVVSGTNTMFVHKDATHYVFYTDWLRGFKP